MKSENAQSLDCTSPVPGCAAPAPWQSLFSAVWFSGRIGYMTIWQLKHKLIWVSHGPWHDMANASEEVYNSTAPCEISIVSPFGISQFYLFGISQFTILLHSKAKHLTDGYLSDRSTPHGEPDVIIKLTKAYSHHRHQKHQSQHHRRHHQFSAHLCHYHQPELMVSQVPPNTDIRTKPIAILFPNCKVLGGFVCVYLHCLSSTLGKLKNLHGEICRRSFFCPDNDVGVLQLDLHGLQVRSPGHIDNCFFLWKYFCSFVVWVLRFKIVSTAIIRSPAHIQFYVTWLAKTGNLTLKLGIFVKICVFIHCHWILRFKMV